MSIFIYSLNCLTIYAIDLHYLFTLFGLLKTQITHIFKTQIMITPKTISFQSIGNSETQNQLFSDEPVILCHGEDFIIPNLIMDNLTKQIDDPQSQCFLVVDIVSQSQRPKPVLSLEKVKISELLPTKKLINLPTGPKQNLEDCLKKVDVSEVIKNYKLSEDQIDVEQKRNNEGEQKRFGSFSIRLFPFHRSFSKVVPYIPPVIQPLALGDILSYQKFKKLSTYQYILALPQYSQKFNPHLETVMYLNWGSQTVEFSLFPEDKREVTKVILQPLEILIIPSRYSYKWSSSQSSLTKLLTWKMIPKKSLPNLLKCLEIEHLRQNCPFSINQVLIDYCFHQFSLIEAVNQSFMYELAKYIDKQFRKELNFLKTQLYVNEKDISGYGPNDKKIDQCENCGAQIVNYFAVHKNLVYCVYCAKEENKINHIYHKISDKVFQEGCKLLYYVYRFKEAKKETQKNVEMLMKSAVFFEFQDFCDGDFLGAYNSAHCKIHQGNSKKQKNSKQKIILNTVQDIKKNIGVSQTLQILSFYSEMKYTNQVQKELYQKILVRTSNFIKKEEQQKWLKIIMPQYKEDDLKLFAIKLCAKDKFDISSQKMSQ